jgi:hypothetical protein
MRSRPTLPSDAEVQVVPVRSHGDGVLDFLRRHPGGAVEALGAGEVEVGFVDRNNLHDGREVVELLADLERVVAV